jgi:hypothetical protein
MSQPIRQSDRLETALRDMRQAIVQAVARRQAISAQVRQRGAPTTTEPNWWTRFKNFIGRIMLWRQDSP